MNRGRSLCHGDEESSATVTTTAKALVRIMNQPKKGRTLLVTGS